MSMIKHLKYDDIAACLHPKNQDKLFSGGEKKKVGR